MIVVPRHWRSGAGFNPSINYSSPQARGLVAALALDGIAHDLTGKNSLNAMTSSPSIFRGTACNAFSGSQDVRLNAGDQLAQATNITICGWFVFSSFANAYNTAFCRGNATQFCDVHVKSTGKLALYIRDSTNTTRFYDGGGAFTLVAGTPYFLALTCTDSTLTGYVNAEFDLNTTAVVGGVQALSGGGTLTVGNNPPNFATRYISGVAFDVRAYNRALTQAELKAIYLDRFDLFADKRVLVSPVAAAGAPTLSDLQAVSITSTTVQGTYDYAF